jgi:hypothetical protein
VGANAQTQRLARNLNRIRERRGPAGDLNFYAYEQGEGESPILTVIKDWAAVLRDDGSYKVVVMEQEGVTGENLYRASRCSFGGVTMTIPQDGIQPPTLAPRAWVIRCNELRPQL